MLQQKTNSSPRQAVILKTSNKSVLVQTGSMKYYMWTFWLLPNHPLPRPLQHSALTCLVHKLCPHPHPLTMAKNFCGEQPWPVSIKGCVQVTSLPVGWNQVKGCWQFCLPAHPSYPLAVRPWLVSRLSCPWEGPPSWVCWQNHEPSRRWRPPCSPSGRQGQWPVFHGDL